MIVKDKTVEKKRYIKKVKRGPNYVLVDDVEKALNPRKPQINICRRTLAGYRKA
jgi:hypothetical protein